jgi:hypothetical protein
MPSVKRISALHPRTVATAAVALHNAPAAITARDFHPAQGDGEWTEPPAANRVGRRWRGSRADGMVMALASEQL